MTSGAALDLRDRVRDVPDFPKPGIAFKDLMPLVADAAYFHETIDRLEQLIAPALRSRNPERRKAGLEDLQALAEASQELSQLLFWRELRHLAER